MTDNPKVQIGSDGVASITWEDIMTTSTTAKFPFGQRAVLSDGSIYHYASAGEALAAGNLCSSADIEANHDLDLAVAATGAGAKTVTVTPGATAVTVNQFQGGRLFVNNEAGEGHSYVIRSHPAAGSATAFVVTLEMPIKVALTTDSAIGFAKNPFLDVLKADTTLLNAPAGVTPCAIASGSYFWLQTWGKCAVLCSAIAPVIGRAIVPSITTTGTVDAFLSDVAAGVIGFCGGSVGVSAEYIDANIMIYP